MNELFAKLTGTGSALPKTVMSNKEFESFVETSDEWIRTRTGIRNRRIVDPKLGESTVSLAEEAGRKALKNAGLEASEIDLIVVGTVTPDTVMPCTANQVQARLGANRAFGFDLQAACSGFLYGLATASSFIRANQAKKALVIGAETLTSLVNWRDRTTCVLFGDAAGAAILEQTNDPSRGVIGTELHSDGRYGDILQIPHGYSKVPSTSADFRGSQSKIQMQGSEVFKLAVRSMVESSNSLLARHGIERSQVDFFLFHQANMRIVEMCMKALEIPPTKTWLNLENYGNTSSATLPVALDEALENGAVKRGDLVLMTTFGGGVTWGSALVRL